MTYGLREICHVPITFMWHGSLNAVCISMHIYVCVLCVWCGNSYGSIDSGEPFLYLRAVSYSANDDSIAVIIPNDLLPSKYQYPWVGRGLPRYDVGVCRQMFCSHVFSIYNGHLKQRNIRDYCFLFFNQAIWLSILSTHTPNAKYNALHDTCIW